MPLQPKRQEPSLLVEFKPRLGALFKQGDSETIKAVCAELGMPQTYTIATDKAELQKKALAALAAKGVEPVRLMEDTFLGARYYHKDSTGPNNPVHDKLLVSFASADASGQPLKVIVSLDLRDRVGVTAAQKLRQLDPGQKVSFDASTRLQPGTGENAGKTFVNRAAHVYAVGRSDWTDKDGNPTEYVSISKEEFDAHTKPLAEVRAATQASIANMGMKEEEASKFVGQRVAAKELELAIGYAKEVEAKGYYKNGHAANQASAPAAPAASEHFAPEDASAFTYEGGDFSVGDEILDPQMLADINAASQRTHLRG